jgi:hypothetical protein
MWFFFAGGVNYNKILRGAQGVKVWEPLSYTKSLLSELVSNVTLTFQCLTACREEKGVSAVGVINLSRLNTALSSSVCWNTGQYSVK